MTESALTARDRLTLLTLMAIGEEPVSNAILLSRAGFRMESRTKARLNEGDLLETTKIGRADWHRLTEKGWAWCTKEMGQPAPAGSDTGTRCLYLNMSVWRRFLDINNKALADLYHPVVDAVSNSASDRSLPSRIRHLYWDLAPEPGDWVSLTEIRTALTDVARDDVDAALRDLNRQPDVSITPQTDQRRLTPADRASAIHLGGKDKHQIVVRTRP